MKLTYKKPELEFEYGSLDDVILVSFGRGPTDNDANVGDFTW